MRFKQLNLRFQGQAPFALDPNDQKLLAQAMCKQKVQLPSYQQPQMHALLLQQPLQEINQHLLQPQQPMD